MWMNEKKDWGRNWFLLTKSHSSLAGCLSRKRNFHEFFYFLKISWECFRGADLHEDRNLRKRVFNVRRVAPGECNRV
jgi:hypothetical protein